MHIAIVAGERSGDQLGAAITRSLLERNNDIRVTGMAGPKMRAAGCNALADTDELSVMGLVEVLKKYPSLRRLRERLVDHYLSDRPDVYVGIDVPDFNFSIEQRLKRAGVKTAHCVAPQIWAWRQARAKSLKEKVDLLLALFPFETEFFSAYGIRTSCIGHPVADLFDGGRNVTQAARALGIEKKGPLVAILPGSRQQEVERHADLFLRAAAIVHQEFEGAQFVAGVVDAQAADLLTTRYRVLGCGFDWTIETRRSHDILRASDVALLASGTITMEATFARTPHVVAYRMAPMTYHVMKRLVKSRYIAMPNILSGRALVPEFVQDDATPQALGAAAIAWLHDDERRTEFDSMCLDIHNDLARDAAGRAAQEILQLAAQP